MPAGIFPYRFTERYAMLCARNLWLVGGGGIGEFMGLRVVGRLGNSAEPLRF